MASERAVVAYCDWFARQVRSRPAKIDQLRVYWESASWRLAFELRAKNSFQHITEEIMGDTQALQDALNREVQAERPRKRTNKTDYGEYYQVQSFKGKGAGKRRPAGKGGGMTAAEIAAIGSFGLVVATESASPSVSVEQ